MLRRYRKDPLKYALDLASLSIIANIVLGFFVVLTWNTYGKVSENNHIAIGLTTIEIFLIVVAFSGFWMLRSLVVEAAVAVAKEAVAEEFNEHKPELRRSVARLVSEEIEELRLNGYGKDTSFSSGEGYDIASAMAHGNGGDDAGDE